MYVGARRRDLGARCWPAASTRSSPGWPSGWRRRPTRRPASDLEEATGLVRPFREQPTPELARSARAGPHLRRCRPTRGCRRFYHPWTSYLIVPLFALANAGIVLNGGFLRHAYTAPITLGVLIGYVVGKPVAVVVTLLAGDPAEPRPDPAAGRLGRGAGQRHDRRHRLHRGAADRRPGLHRRRAWPRPSSARCRRRWSPSVLTWVRLPADRGCCPPARRARALLGDVRADPGPDPRGRPGPRPHPRPDDSARSPSSSSATSSARTAGRPSRWCASCSTDTDLRYVWRHLPLTDVHPRAQLAAEAPRRRPPRASSGRCTTCCCSTRTHLDRDRPASATPASSDLDADRFHDELDAARARRPGSPRTSSRPTVSGVSGTPTFFINGQRHYGAYDLPTLTEAIRVARERAITGTAPDWAPDEVYPRRLPGRRRRRRAH